MDDRDNVMFLFVIFLLGMFAVNIFFLPQLKKMSHDVICRVKIVLGLDPAPEAVEINKFKRRQALFTALLIVFLGGYAIQRALSIDPVGANGRRCGIYTNDIKRYNFLNRLKEVKGDPFALLDPDKIGRMCDAALTQQIVELREHPVAVIIGSILPALILAPFAYWVVGRTLRRHDANQRQRLARFKICEFCAETIKVEAKVCRYCGRELSQPNVSSP